MLNMERDKRIYRIALAANKEEVGLQNERAKKMQENISSLDLSVSGMEEIQNKFRDAFSNLVNTRRNLKSIKHAILDGSPVRAINLMITRAQNALHKAREFHSDAKLLYANMEDNDTIEDVLGNMHSELKRTEEFIHKSQRSRINKIVEQQRERAKLNGSDATTSNSA